FDGLHHQMADPNGKQVSVELEVVVSSEIYRRCPRACIDERTVLVVPCADERQGLGWRLALLEQVLAIRGVRRTLWSLVVAKHHVCLRDPGRYHAARLCVELHAPLCQDHWTQNRLRP